MFAVSCGTKEPQILPASTNSITDSVIPPAIRQKFNLKNEKFAYERSTDFYLNQTLMTIE